MTTTWVVYRDLEPWFEMTASPAKIQRVLDELKRARPDYIWDAYAQKWGEWFND